MFCDKGLFSFRMTECKNCGEESSKYPLCLSCYYDYEDKKIDKCKCGNYKDAGYELCVECYKKSKSKGSQKKTHISDSAIKGRLAESIVEEMFLAMGYRVFRFGMENTVPGFSDRVLPRKGVVASHVRKMPDFIIVKDTNIAYIEVKYRTCGEFDFKKYYTQKGGYPYPNAYFVLITPKYIKIQKASELEKGESFIYLGKCKDFETDKSIILKYRKLCMKFFGNFKV